MKDKFPKCPICDFAVGHAPHCESGPRESLSDTEHAYWRGGFIQGGGDPATGDRMLRRYWAVVKSGEPCLLNDPNLEEPALLHGDVDCRGLESMEVSIGDARVTIQVKPYSPAETIVDAINAELIKRDLPPTAGAGR